MKSNIGDYIWCFSFLVVGIIIIVMGLRYTKQDKDDDKNSRYVIAVNGWFDEFLRSVLPYMPLWIIRLVYLMIGVFFLIIGINMLIYVIG